MSDPKHYRDRKFCLLLYPEDQTHAACMELLKSGGYTFAAILHDKDVYEDGDQKGELKKEHWHVVVKFKNAIWNSALAKELGIAPNYIQECRNLDAALLYLVHFGLEDEKAQYDLEAVFGPLSGKLATLLADTDEGTRALGVANIIRDTPGYLSFYDALKKVADAGLYSDFRRMGALAVNLIREHNAEHEADLLIALDRDRELAKFAGPVTRVGHVPFNRYIDIMDKNGLLPDPDKLPKP